MYMYVGSDQWLADKIGPAHNILVSTMYRKSDQHSLAIAFTAIIQVQEFLVSLGDWASKSKEVLYVYALMK